MQKFLWLIPVLVALGVHGNDLNHGFVWDDRVVVENQMSAFHTLGDVFFPGKGIEQLSETYYRPMVYISYLLDTLLWKENPFGFHLTNVVLHLLNTLLVFCLARSLLGADAIAGWWGLWSALFFAVHPANVEAVAWVSARPDSLATLWIILSLLLFLKFKEEGAISLILGSAIFYLLSILSKESTLGFVVLFPIVLRLMSSDYVPWRRLVLVCIPYGVAVGIWAVLRVLALGDVTSATTFPWSNLSNLLVQGWYGSGFYLRLLFWPLHLSVFPELSHSVIIGFFAFLNLLITLGLLYWAWQKGDGIPLMLVVWWWLSLAPPLLIAAVSSQAPLAERYFYLPSAGGLLLIGYGLAVWGGSMGRLKWVTLILLVPLFSMAYLTVARSRVWQDDLHFWQATVRDTPHRWFSHQNLALAYSGKGNFQEAEKEFLKALERTERGEEKQKTLTSLGIDALKQKEHEKAERYFIEAQGYNEKSPYLQYNLGILYLSDPKTHENTSDPTRLRKALAYFEKAAEYNPYYIKALLSSGSIHRVLGDEQKARERLQKVLVLSRRDGEYVRAARHELALVAFAEAMRLNSAGEVEQAIPLYEEALGHDPTFAEGHYMLADRLLGKGRLDEAIMHLQEAIRMRPDFADAHYSRGRALTMKGDIPGAIEAYHAFQKYWKGDPRFLDIARGEVQTLEGRLKGR